MTGKPRMIRTGKSFWSLFAGMSLIALPSAAGGMEPNRYWSAEDVVTVPKVISLALSSDGKDLAYIEKVAALRENRTLYIVYHLDLATRVRKEIVRAASADHLKAIAGAKAWNVLLDLGQGQQLYQIDAKLNVGLVVANEDDVQVGQTEGGLFAVTNNAPHRVGVLGYDWSPDRKWLWYAALKPAIDRPQLKRDDDVIAQKHRRRAPVSAMVELRLRSPTGEDILVATRPTKDRLAFYFAGTVKWTKDGLRYYVETTSGTQSDESEAFELKFGSTASMSVGKQQRLPSVDFVRGPRGGLLASSGLGTAFELVETQASAPQHSYGKYPFYVGDPRAAASWRSTDGQRTVLGMRTTKHPRYGLALVTLRGVRPILTNGSLTRCDFRADVDWGVCVEESMTRSPRLVRVEPGTGKIDNIIELSARHQAITPLRTTAHTWTNRHGLNTTGFIVWPRGFEKGEKYPAIVVTHGSDADERFAEQDFQWDYPVQLWAERGYLVILVNEPSPRQDPGLMAAYAQWRAGRGELTPEELQRHVWLNVIDTLEDVVGQIAKEGTLDATRVGIAGYSRGSQITNVAVTQSGLFKAASSGDGSFLEPAAYHEAIRSYTAIFGGPPAGENLQNYRRLSPSLRADRVCAPVLHQMAAPFAGAIEFHLALRSARVPAQIGLYPGETVATDETHLFHIPSNRLQAMRENLAWFDFWLRGERDRDFEFPDDFDRWARMAEDLPERCQSQPLSTAGDASVIK